MHVLTRSNAAHANDQISGRYAQRREAKNKGCLAKAAIVLTNENIWKSGRRHGNRR